MESLPCPFCIHLNESSFVLTHHIARCRFATCTKRKLSMSNTRLYVLSTVPTAPFCAAPKYSGYACHVPGHCELAHSGTAEISGASSGTEILLDEMTLFLNALARKTGSRMANQLLGVFHNKDSDLNKFRDKIKSISHSQCTPKFHSDFSFQG